MNTGNSIAFPSFWIYSWLFSVMVVSLQPANGVAKAIGVTEQGPGPAPPSVQGPVPAPLYRAPFPPLPDMFKLIYYVSHASVLMGEGGCGWSLID